MNCKQAQLHLLINDAVPQAARDHVAKCIHCQSVIRADQSFESKISRWHPLKPASWSISGQSIRTRVILCISAAVGAVTLIAIVLAGQSAGVAYRKMSTCVNQATSVYFRVVNYPSLQSSETWWKPGSWRETSGSRQGADRIKRVTPEGLIFSRFDPVMQRSESIHEKSVRAEDFTFESLIVRFMDPPSQFELVHLGPNQDRIVAESFEGTSRMVYQIDNRTHLPAKVEKQFRTGTGPWTTSAKIEFEFNHLFPPQTFDSNDLDKSAGGHAKTR